MSHAPACMHAALDRVQTESAAVRCALRSNLFLLRCGGATAWDSESEVRWQITEEFILLHNIFIPTRLLQQSRWPSTCFWYNKRLPASFLIEGCRIGNQANVVTRFLLRLPPMMPFVLGLKCRSRRLIAEKDYCAESSGDAPAALLG